jgi:hypothetical protein
MIGDETILTSSVYDLSNYSYVLLRFSHICKISPRDIARIEYRTDIGGGDMSVWTVLPATSYLGKANVSQYAIYGFNANSYSEWKAGDSLAFPSQSWWKGEIFDVSFEVASTNQAQFRFVIQHGNTAGTQISYGWLIDDIEIIADSSKLLPPDVEFIAPLVQDTVYTTGPWEINAKVKTRTNATLENPYLKYTATYNGVPVTNDSILMLMIEGDSLWAATIPQFVVGTEISYFITGIDSMGNETRAISDYVITKPNHPYGNNSTAPTAMISPVYGQTMGNTTVPIEIILKNKGDSTLTSVTIYRSINGVVNSYPWTGNLFWDFEQQISVGTYQPRMNSYDTIIIWVSNPNNTPDFVLEDDTLSIITYGSPSALAGLYTVGEGEMFPSIEEALYILRLSPPTGNITLALRSGTYTENWNLSNLSNIMGNHTLTITSLANHRDSVILRPPSGAGILLANSNNLVLKAITVDMATISAYGIQFTSACTNVVIRDCKILADTITDKGAPIYKGSNTGIVNNIAIVSNLLEGGYYGAFFYGGPGYATGQYGTNVVFDSNTLINQYYYGTDFRYIDFISCSYNTVLSRTTTGVGTNWRAIYMEYCNGFVSSNRVRQRSNAINAVIGLYTYYFNYYNTSDVGLIVNNEIIVHTTGAFYGIYPQVTKAKILHNSVYISGTGAARGLNLVDNAGNWMIIKNNNIIMESTDAFPVYLSAVTNIRNYDIDYNNPKMSIREFIPHDNQIHSNGRH